MSNNYYTLDYKGHQYTFYRGWGLDSDIEVVKAFLDDKKLSKESYCVIVHDGADPDNRKHQKIITMSGLKTYWGNIIHRGPFFHDESGNDYQIFISHAWNGDCLTYRQKKHIQEEFEKQIARMRNIKSIHFYYQDVIPTKRSSLRFNFYDYSGDEIDKLVLKSFKFDKPIKDFSYCVVKYNGSVNWSTNDLIFRHESYMPLVYSGPAFYDDEGNDYEILISKKWKGEKLNQDQKDELKEAFAHLMGKGFRKKYIDTVEYHWQTVE